MLDHTGEHNRLRGVRPDLGTHPGGHVCEELLEGHLARVRSPVPVEDGGPAWAHLVLELGLAGAITLHVLHGGGRRCELQLVDRVPGGIE